MRFPPAFDLDQDGSRHIRVDSELTEPNLKDVPRRPPLHDHLNPRKDAHGDEFLRVPTTSVLMDDADNARHLSGGQIGHRQRANPTIMAMPSELAAATPEAPRPGDEP
jgi:hypothetical protein